jgi:site-specific DNA-cytosine methylase
VFGFALPVSEAFSVEKDKHKQAFILRNHSVRLLIANTHELQCPRATNLRTSVPELVPFCDVFAAGFSCKSRSSLNAMASKLLACVQKGTGETGQTWSDIYAYISIATPPIVVLENVSALDQYCPETDSSDAAYIIEELSKLRYAARWVRTDARAHGSIARRDRLYLVGFHASSTAEHDAMSLALSELDGLLLALQIASFEFADFVSDDDGKYLAPIPKSAMGSEAAGFWEDHRTLYQNEHFTYPPNRESFSAEFRAACEPMSERQFQGVAFMMQKFPETEMTGRFHSIDYNFSLPRLKGRTWNVDCLPTLCGSTKVSEVVTGQFATVLPWYVFLPVAGVDLPHLFYNHPDWCAAVCHQPAWRNIPAAAVATLHSPPSVADREP